MQKTPTHRSSRTALALMAAAASMPATTTVATAQQSGFSNSGHSNIAEREMFRRAEAVREAEALLDQGRVAYKEKDYQKAFDLYNEASRKLPDAPLVQDRRSEIDAHLSDAAVALSQQYRKVGKYTEARQVLEPLAATNPLAKRELDYLDDPIRTNPALTLEHTQNVDQVRRHLYMAEGHYNLGKFDDAKKEYDKVIRIDPYNRAARRGMERVAARKSDYYRAAYDHTRAELLMQVDQAWELAVPVEAPILPDTMTPRRPDGGSIYITEKLRRIIIPSINFEDTTVEEAIDFLRLRSRELDNIELDPDRKGVNFVIRRPGAGDGGGDADPGGFGGLPTGGGNLGARPIRELRLRNVPLAVALQYICDAANLRYRVDDFAVTLVPASDTDANVTSRSFIVPPDFRSIISQGGGGTAPADLDPFAPAAPTGPRLLGAQPPIKDVLQSAGVNFGDGTSAVLTANGVLTVTNTPLELEKVEQLVDMSGTMKPKQVKITTKFVEINQENTDELGFDWIVSPFGSATGNYFVGGGTIGSGVPRTGVDFGLPAIPGIPTSGGNVSNIVTAGLRSGDTGLNRNSIDAILNNPNRGSQNTSVAPGIASITGVFSDGAVQMIMRGLAQKKGTDLMTAPSVTARSGQKATIEIIREFIYPTEYDPPEIPQSFGNNNQGGGGGGILDPITGNPVPQPASFPVTPATPTSFETRNTGVTLEIEPTIGENDFVIDLRFVPEIVEFEGFINYGSPIQTNAVDALGNAVPLVITENRIEMPVFSSRRVNTALTIYDGYTVAVGGLMREDVQNIEDKVPILGDIPIIGRLFQSKAENRIKSNLIIFVTAQIIDATGRPLRGTDAIEQPLAADGMDFEPGVLPPIPVGF
jgi:general secretion pathway protein D